MQLPLPMRHGGGLLAPTLVLAVSGFVLVPLPATAVPPTTSASARAAAPTRIRVVIHTARGVPAKVRLRHGTHHHTVSKPARGERFVRRVRVTPGTWHVRGPAVLAKGKVWDAEVRRAGAAHGGHHSITVRVRRHHAVTVHAEWFERSAARLWVARTSGTRAVLKWRSPVKDVRFMVRRGRPSVPPAALNPAPATVHDGTLVYKGTARRVVAKGLTAGRAYPFSVFVRNRGAHPDRRWAGPVSVWGTTHVCAVQSSLSGSECRALMDIARANPDARLPDWWVGDPCADVDLRKGVLCVDGHVDELFLADTGLRTVPASITRLTRLRLLNLASDHVTSLPDGLPDLSNLELAHNGLTRVPSAIRGLSHLGSLGLGHNHLTKLPRWIGHLTALFSLDVHHNRLSTLPDGFGRLSHLVSFVASHNRLTRLPGAIRHLSALKHLVARNIGLRSVPTWIDDLPLQKLNLGHNALVRVPAAIGKLSDLRILWLDHNGLRRLPASFGKLTKVIRLGVSYNRLFGDISAWAGPLSRNGSISSGTNSVGLTHNGCLNAGGDSDLAAWLDSHAKGWRSGC